MADLLPTALLEHVHHGREERNLEYKEILDWTRAKHQIKIAKCVLGMSNVRNGGVLVIGIRKDGVPVGLTEAQARLFDQDHVSALVNEFAAPYAEITVTVGRDAPNSPMWFVVVEIKEFEEQPVICRKDGHELAQGGLYTRGRRIHETALVRSEAEMREILDMAVEKRLRAFRRMTQAAGIEMTPTVNSRQLLDAQLGGL